MERPITTEKRATSRIGIVATRFLAGAVAALILLQGASAGSHLTGVGGALGLHRRVGTELLTLLALVAVVTAAMAVKARWWALPAAIAGFLGIGAQIGMGFADQLQVHLPLGVALFGLYLAMAVALTDPNKEKRS
jgi:hypothetical protein